MMKGDGALEKEGRDGKAHCIFVMGNKQPERVASTNATMLEIPRMRSK